MIAIDLEPIRLARGGHSTRDEGMCATELVAYLAGETHTDHPKCLSPVLGQFLRSWNDSLDDAGRQRLKPFLPRTVGTAGDGHDELRGWLCADWLIRVHTPAWLELAGIADSAAALRGLPPIRSLAVLKSSRPEIDTAKKKGYAAWDAAWVAARVAAWDAAWVAAWDAAWDAAGVAAWDAAGAAAKKAADAKLEPTKIELQASALELLESLIDPKGAADDAAHGGVEVG